MNKTQYFLELTCANANGDAGRVTTTTNRVAEIAAALGVTVPFLYQDTDVIISLKYKRQVFKITFNPTREDAMGFFRSLSTLAWPRRLKMPKTGLPVNFEVVDVKYA